MPAWIASRRPAGATTVQRRYTGSTVPDLEEPFIAPLLAAVGVLVAVGLGVLLRRSARHRVDALAAAFEAGTAHTVGLLASTVAGIFRGYVCRYTIQPRSQYNPGGATLRVDVTSPLEWSASRQDAGARIMAGLGILKDIRLGDEELDALRIASRDESALRSTLGQESVRSALRDLMRTAGFHSISVRSDRALARWSPRRPELDENVEVVRRRLEATVAVLAACGDPPRMG